MDVKKLAIRAGALLLLSAAGLAGFVILKAPSASVPRAGQVPVSPERIERGKYLFHHVALCVDCHTPRDITKYPMPIDPQKVGQGWVWPVEEQGSSLVAPNITPDMETGLGRWTDGEKIRAIREGVSKEGRALHPMMPYMSYKSMSDADVEAVVAYINSLPPAKNPLPSTKLAFPFSVIVKWLPEPLNKPATTPDPADRVAYGRYLTSIGTCLFCHTPGDPSPDMKRRYAGGREFKGGPRMIVRSSNLTPDPETGLGKWSEERFVSRFAEFKEYNQPDAKFPALSPANFTVMHWLSLSGMQEADLRAIYAYLRTLPAQVNKVEVHPPSTTGGVAGLP